MKVIRNLHLYLGLFFAPFVLLFAVSVFFLVHAWLPGADAHATAPRIVQNVALPGNLDRLDGRERVEAVREVLNRIGVAGEIGFIQHIPEEHRLAIPLSVPGRQTDVDINLAAHTATVTQRTTGLWDALVTLHRQPGPHLAAIRMNWLPAIVWRWFADATVGSLFFISISGVYMWVVLRAERRAGLALIAAGAFSFFGIVYALVH